MATTAQVFKKLTISSQLVKLAEFKAKTLGLNFQEYVKHLITEDVKDILSKFKFLKEDEVELLNKSLDPSIDWYRAKRRRKQLEDLISSWKDITPPNHSEENSENIK